MCRSQIPLAPNYANHKYHWQQMMQITNTRFHTLLSSVFRIIINNGHFHGSDRNSCTEDFPKKYLSHGVKRGWSICFLLSTLLSCCCSFERHRVSSRPWVVNQAWKLPKEGSVIDSDFGWKTSFNPESWQKEDWKKMDRDDKTVKEKSKFIVHVILKKALELIGVIHVMACYNLNQILK